MNNIKINTLIFAFFSMGERFISFFTLPLITKNVSESDYAVWMQTIVTAGLLTPVIILGFGTSLVKFYPLYKDFIFNIMRFMLFIVIIIFSIFSIFSIFFKNFFSGLIYGTIDYSNIVIPFLILLLGEVLFEFFVGFMRSKNYIKYISSYLFLKGLLRILILYLVLVYLKNDIYEAIWCFSLIQLFMVIVLYLIHFPIMGILQGNQSIENNVYKEILKFSVPLVPMAILVGLGNFSDRYFMAHNNYGLAEVGVYSAVYSLVGVAAFFYSSIGFTLFPRLSKYWSIGNKEESAHIFLKILQLYFALIIPFILGVTVLGSHFLISIATEAYLAPKLLFFLLALNVAMFGIYQICYYIQLLEHGSSKGLYLIFISTISNIFLNLLLIPKYGVLGAATAGLVSVSILAASTFRAAFKVLRWSFPWKDLLQIIIHAVVMAILLLLLTKIISNQSFYTLLGEIFFGIIIYSAMNLSSSTSIRYLIKNK